MIVVVASSTDAGACHLVARWRDRGARLLTPADLSRPGWRVDPGDPGRAQAVIEGEIVAADEIAGVLTRLPAVTDADVPSIALEDRHYAATEMHAFLTYWLSSLACPVVNPPGASSPCGPTWRSERWALEAARMGLALEPCRRRVPAFGAPAEPLSPASGPVIRLTVVSDSCLGPGDAALARAALDLARAAGAPMLAVVFRDHPDGPRFLDAHRWVDVADPDIADALLQHLDAAVAVGSGVA